MLSSFKDLLAATGTPANAGRGILDALRERLLPSLKWRQAQLINKLYERRHAGDYAESARAMAKGRPVLRVLVMGGGAIGLRCAVELALLGHSVLALEQRRSFTRLTLRSGGVQSRTRDACRHNYRRRRVSDSVPSRCWAHISQPRPHTCGARASRAKWVVKSVFSMLFGKIIIH